MERRLRLRHGADFRRVRVHGRHHSGRLLRMLVAAGNCAHNRYGVVAGKGLGNAVKRNRARRLLREALRALHPHLRPGHDLVLVARPAMVGVSMSSLRAALARQMRRAGLLLQEGDAG